MVLHVLGCKCLACLSQKKIGDIVIAILSFLLLYTCKCFKFFSYLVIPPQNECFQGYTGISLSVRPSVFLSVCPIVYKILVSVKVLAGVLTLSSIYT